MESESISQAWSQVIHYETYDLFLDVRHIPKLLVSKQTLAFGNPASALSISINSLISGLFYRRS